LRRQRNVVIRAARLADAGEQQTQVVMDLGNGADGGTREVDFCSIEMAGDNPSMWSTSGFSINDRN